MSKWHQYDSFILSNLGLTNGKLARAIISEYNLEDSDFNAIKSYVRRCKKRQENSSIEELL